MQHVKMFSNSFAHNYEHWNIQPRANSGVLELVIAQIQRAIHAMYSRTLEAQLVGTNIGCRSTNTIL
jgi:hypothetical protein